MGRPSKAVKYHKAKGAYYSTYEDPATGRPRSHYFKAATEAAALLEWAEWQRQRETDVCQRAIDENVRMSSLRDGDSPSEPASRERLSDALAFWREWKAEQDRKPGYLSETERNFNRLIKVVGNKPLNQITKADFVQFERYLNREAESNDWHTRSIKGLRAVFNLCIRKDTLPLPDGLAKWLAAIESRPVVPAATNRHALPPDVFTAMLGHCRKLADLDVEAMPMQTQADKARRNRAYDRKRNAVQFTAILSLAAQTGFGPEDICGLEWSHFHLEGDAPYVDYPRSKTEWKTGVATARKIPLLPATVVHIGRARPDTIAAG